MSGVIGLSPKDLFYLDEAVPNVLWDAKYASPNNFTGRPVAGYECNRVALSGALIAPLTRARDEAAAQNLSLLVWDALRPQRAVDDFMKWVLQPEDGKTKAAHYPRLNKSDLPCQYVARRSAHTRGAAVDLTLVAPDGTPLDMGGDFDVMDEISHHGAKGLTDAQNSNRNLLRALMEKSGFTFYKSEWWHYSLSPEPYIETYFDFIIQSAR